MWTYLGRTTGGIELFAAPAVARGLRPPVVGEEEEARYPAVDAIVTWSGPYSTEGDAARAKGGVYYFEFAEPGSGMWRPLYVGQTHDFSVRVKAQLRLMKHSIGRGAIRFFLGEIRQRSGGGPVIGMDPQSTLIRRTVEHAIIRSLGRKRLGGVDQRRKAPYFPHVPLFNASAVRPFQATGSILVEHRGSVPEPNLKRATTLIRPGHWYEFEAAG